MKIFILFLILIVLNACAASKFKSEFDFANKLAQDGLWKEAYFRWEKVLSKGKKTAAIFNNMAVALENMGKLDMAEKMYKKALELSPNHPQIQSNYDKLKGKSIKDIKREKNEK